MERKQAVTPIDIQKIKKELEEKRKELLTFLNSPRQAKKGTRIIMSWHSITRSRNKRTH
jgi:hypothetical protein